MRPGLGDPRSHLEQNANRNNSSARENRVPYYQRLFQDGEKKHIRQWVQVCLVSFPFRQLTVSPTHLLTIMNQDTEEQTNALPVLRRALWRLCRYVEANWPFGGNWMKTNPTT